MKTKTYDLNLYVVDGEVRVLAHQLSVDGGGYIATNGWKFTEIVNIPALRKTAKLWRPVLAYFDEQDLYDELDAWALATVESCSVPQQGYTNEQLAEMPEVLRDALVSQPEYEVM